MSAERLRRATDADLAALLSIEARAGQESWSDDALRGLLDHPCGEDWVRTERGAVIAHLLALVVADEAEIITVAVDPEHHRRGHGRALLDAVLDGWGARGVSRVFLEVRIDNAPARALYAAAGFAEVGRRRRYYADGTDALVLERRLGRPGAISG